MFSNNAKLKSIAIHVDYEVTFTFKGNTKTLLLIHWWQLNSRDLRSIYFLSFVSTRRASALYQLYFYLQRH